MNMPMDKKKMVQEIIEAHSELERKGEDRLALKLLEEIDAECPIPPMIEIGKDGQFEHESESWNLAELDEFVLQKLVKKAREYVSEKHLVELCE